MAYSQFLQQKSYLYSISLSDEQDKVYICCRVLESLENWIIQDGHEDVIASIGILHDELLSVLQEFTLMYNQGELGAFLHDKIIKSTNILHHCEEAYQRAVSASQACYDDDAYTASGHITHCQKALHKAIKCL